MNSMINLFWIRPFNKWIGWLFSFEFDDLTIEFDDYFRLSISIVDKEEKSASINSPFVQNLTPTQKGGTHKNTENKTSKYFFL
jgi:hypothetical protein